MKNLLILLLLLPGCMLRAQDTLKTHNLQEVVVTGQFEPQSMKQSLYQVRTITAEMIQQRNAVNLQTVLSTELGIRFSNDKTLGTSDITVMGMAGQGVKIMVDGVPMFDRGETRESLNQIDINTIERIEIVEGPMSVVYGTDALAGVINIITKKGAADGGKLSVLARVQEETVGDEYNAFTDKGVHNESVTVNGSRKNWYGDVGVTRNNFGGWQGNLTGRAKDWLPKDQWLAHGTAGFRRDNFNAWYTLNYLNENIHTLGDIAEVGTKRTATDKEYITNRYTHQLQAEWKISDAIRFNGAASYQDYSRRTRTTVYDFNTERRTLSTGAGEQDLSEFNSVFFRGMFYHRVSQTVSFQYGTELNHNKGMGDRIDGTRTIDDYALFVSSEIKPLPALAIRPGVRFLHNSVYDAPPAIPSLNLKYALNSTMDIRMSYARGYRAPALRELFFSFHDSNHNIDGNPDLKAEHSNSLTASFSWQVYNTGAVRFSTVLAGFYNDYRDMITIGFTDATSNSYQYINVLRRKTRGGTLTNNIHWKDLQATVGFSYIGFYDTFAETDAAWPEMLWAPEVNTTLRYAIRPIGVTLGAYYKLNGRLATFEIIDGQVNKARRNGYQWLDVTGTKTLGKYITLGAGVKNLMNVVQVQNNSQDIGGAHSTGGPVPMGYGRSYFLSLAFRLDK